MICCIILIRRKNGTVLVEIFSSSTQPGAFCNGQHIGVKTILTDNVFLFVDAAVVPYSKDSSGNVIVALFYIADMAVI